MKVIFFGSFAFLFFSLFLKIKTTLNAAGVHIEKCGGGVERTAGTQISDTPRKFPPICYAVQWIGWKKESSGGIIEAVLMEDDFHLDGIFTIDESKGDCRLTSTRINELTLTPREVVKRVYSLARTISSLLDRLGIWYWTSGGTTLGAVRHRGLIPWDDDVDLCILQQQEDKFVANKDRFEALGLRITESNTFGFRIFHESESAPLDEGLDHRYPFCDIFLMHQQGKKFVLSRRIARTLWPNESYNIKDILERSENVKFGDFYLRCPGNAERYLTKTYGQNWMTVGETQNYDHRTKERLQSRQFIIDTMEPAKPFM